MHVSTDVCILQTVGSVPTVTKRERRELGKEGPDPLSYDGLTWGQLGT